MGFPEPIADTTTSHVKRDGQVVLFSGHMIDAPRRATPRFPAALVPNAITAIRDTLDAWDIGPGDLGICGGACGGDLLFAEACLRRDARLELLLPFDIPEFIDRSVAFAGDAWVRLFYTVAGDPRTTVILMPDELGAPPEGISPYARHAQWLIDRAVRSGPDRMRFLCLWDGKAGDGPGGTHHMLEEVRRQSGQASIIDIASLQSSEA